jgi:hypothetical protein
VFDVFNVVGWSTGNRRRVWSRHRHAEVFEALAHRPPHSPRAEAADSRLERPFRKDECRPDTAIQIGEAELWRSRKAMPVSG